MGTTLLAIDGTLLVIGDEIEPPWIEAVEYTVTFAQAAARASTKAERGSGSSFMMSRASYTGPLVKDLQLVGWRVPSARATVTRDAQSFHEDRPKVSLAERILDPVASGLPVPGHAAPSKVLRRAEAVAGRAGEEPSALQFWWSSAYDPSASKYVNVGFGGVSATGDASQPIKLGFTIASFDPSGVKLHAGSRPDTWRSLLVGRVAEIPKSYSFTVLAELDWAAYSRQIDMLKSRIGDKLADHVDSMTLD